MLSILRTANTRTRTLLTLGIVMLASVVVIACGSAAANTGTKTSGGTGNQANAAAKHFKVGDQVKVGNTFVVTVNSVKTSKGDDIIQPKAGDTFLVVDVTIKNISSEEQDVSSLLQFTLKDATGQKYDETILTSTTSPDGKVEPGDLIRGQIPYEVPTSQHAFTLAFEADIISSGQTIWDLKI